MCYHSFMLYLGADHAGFGIKKELIQFCETCCIDYEDCGAVVFDKSDDYPPYALTVARNVVADPGSFGVLICGTGTGMVVVANKVKGVRAAFGFSDYAAKMARTDNNANVLTFSGRKQTADEVIRMVKIFIETPFSDAERHQRRLAEIAEIEEECFENYSN